MTSRCVIKSLVALLASAVLMGLSAQTLFADEAQNTSYQLGTANVGSKAHAVGVTLSALIKLKLFPDVGIDVNTVNTSGSLSNAQLLHQDEIDFAILDGMDAEESWTGTGVMADRGPDRELRALAGLWRRTHEFIIRKDFLSTGTLDDFLDIQGKRVVLGSQGSVTLAENRILFGNLDLDIDDTYVLENFDIEETIDAFQEGRIDGIGLSTGALRSSLGELMDQLGDEAVLLDVTEDQARQADGGLGLWSRQVIPPDTFAGQDRRRGSLATTSVLGVDAEVDDEVVYQITKTIFDNLPFLHDMHAATKGIELDIALDGLQMPIHPGAVRYYKEIGADVPLITADAGSDLIERAFLTRFRDQVDVQQRLNARTVTVLGGPANQTFSRVTSEMALSLEASDIRVVGMSSQDSAHNIADLLYLKGVDAAHVQIDVLNYALNENVYPNIRGKIGYIAELFAEEIHLLGGRGIDDIQDLAGKKVNLCTSGSGAELTAAILFDALGLDIEVTHDAPSLAFERLKRGELAGAIFVSGKPMSMLAEISEDEDVKLLTVPSLQNDAYRPAVLTHEDYPVLVDENEPVQTMAVRTALIAYNWDAGNSRYTALEQFVNALFNNVGKIQAQEIGFHPKWGEIDPFNQIEGWQRQPAAEAWIDAHRSKAGRSSSVKPILPLAPDSDLAGNGKGGPLPGSEPPVVVKALRDAAPL